ncbi:peptidylprolyl isomerase [Mesonia mobilis]|uniref:Peptidyl-prolyl cis-trans isomerase n=1 Tax=Mesonia mobilis TaxID=369791 RepID=A0ABQ3BSE3_9FLAO|nr:peptidylprolyl isomerase [Mesonia mobilis]MBQ0739175.1 peptidylprolyl isomerase [Aquimarina celericrescens]GGZ52632.1 peptidyl-prolyl cis-trans isomerase [Mesonia mobilis]
MKKISLLLFCLFAVGLITAQQSQDVLLTIDGKPVYAKEFKRVFSKNLSIIEEDEKQDVDEYLDLFIDYKLKVIEAEDLKLDTLPTFTGEYNIYKKQLARKFINQSEVSSQLLEEAYDRLQQEVNASHILFNLAADASPEDTLKVYEQALKVRNEILASDKDFSSFAKKYSEDPSARQNGGDLGWFGVFNMVYPFESGAYETEVGEISMPVRSKFGYHLVKVNDKRKNEGEVTVAHIMIESGKDDEAAKEQIEKLYTQLQEGAQFEDLAKQYSDDKNTAVNGGKLNTFKRGRLNSEKFEDAAFSLSGEGEISKPIQSKYGWHIIKLLKKDAVGTFEQEKFILERNIKKDSRAQLIASEVLAKIKSTYNLKEDDSDLSYFKKNIEKNITAEPWEDRELTSIPQKDLISIKQEGKTYADFAKYVASRQKQSTKFKNTNDALEAWYEDFKDGFYREYHREHLEEVDQEYAHVIEEYKNGLLLFDLMEKKVWNAAKEDSIALQNYYQKHQSDFVSSPKIEGVIASASNKSLLKKARKALKKNELEEVKENFEEVIFNSGEFGINDSSLPENFKVKEGVSKIYQNNGTYVVVKVNEVEKAETLTFEESKGQVISAYQNELEDRWIASLRAKHKVDVNKATLAKLKKEFE